MPPAADGLPAQGSPEDRIDAALSNVHEEGALSDALRDPAVGCPQQGSPSAISGSGTCAAVPLVKSANARPASPAASSPSPTSPARPRRRSGCTSRKRKRQIRLWRAQGNVAGSTAAVKPDNQVLPVAGAECVVGGAQRPAPCRPLTALRAAEQPSYPRARGAIDGATAVDRARDPFSIGGLAGSVRARESRTPS